MTPAEIRELIIADHPDAYPTALELYARHFAVWFEAQTNIQRFGAVNAHPRTGVPIDNPYLKIKDAVETKLARFNLNPKALWAEANRRLAALENST